MYDVLNNESIAAMINKVAEDLGGIYGLVNHCPGPKAGTFEALTEADWADGYQKCLYSYTTAICAALPYMKKGGGGRIVNSTSSSIKQELDMGVSRAGIKSHYHSPFKPCTLESG